MLKLTDQGRKEVSNFVQKCEEFRKELLETGRDTGLDRQMRKLLRNMQCKKVQ